eukprot:522708-Amphidinium_carterae.1
MHLRDLQGEGITIAIDGSPETSPWGGGAGGAVGKVHPDMCGSVSPVAFLAKTWDKADMEITGGII